MTVADRIANERGEVLGDTVGVSVSFIDKCTENTQIKVNILLYIMYKHLNINTWK